MQFRVNESVEVPEWRTIPRMVYVGTVTQIKKNKVRVLFPICKFVWLEKSRVRKV